MALPTAAIGALLFGRYGRLGTRRLAVRFRLKQAALRGVWGKPLAAAAKQIALEEFQLGLELLDSRALLFAGHRGFRQHAAEMKQFLLAGFQVTGQSGVPAHA